MPVLLDPKSIPKYTQQLVIPPVYTPTPVNVGGTMIDTYQVEMVSGVMQQILPPGFPATPVWAYKGLTNVGVLAHSPAATFEATKGTPVRVTWINNVASNYMFRLTRHFTGLSKQHQHDLGDGASHDGSGSTISARIQWISLHSACNKHCRKSRRLERPIASSLGCTLARRRDSFRL